MTAGDGRELFYSLDVIQTIKRIEANYVYRETGLTLETCYNDNDYRYYAEVAEEVLPKELRSFLALLMWKLPALEEGYSSDLADRLREYLEEIIEEDGEEL